jgi:hypothetical protein
MMSDVERRLVRLERTEAARVIGARYGRACDAKSVQALRDEVFTNDVVLRVPGAELSGIEAVADFYQGAFDAEPGTRRHFVVNQIVEPISDDEYLVDSYFVFVSEDRSSVIGWGSYRDVVSFESGAARIREKTIALDVHTTLGEGWAAGRARGVR